MKVVCNLGVTIRNIYKINHMSIYQKIAAIGPKFFSKATLFKYGVNFSQYKSITFCIVKKTIYITTKSYYKIKRKKKLENTV